MSAITLTKDKAQKQISNILYSSDPSPEEAIEIRNSVHEFAQKYIRPYDDGFEGQPGVDETHQFPHHLWKELGNQGLLGITIPEEYGGTNQGYMRHVMITEEISAASGSVGLSYIAHSNLCMNQIALNGTPEQKAKYLPRLASGEWVGALAMSEADAGSDVMSMKTSGEKVDGGWVVNGTKLWITNGGRIANGNPVTADVLVLYKRTGEKKTAAILEGGMSGFKPGYKINKETLHGSETWELKFDDCFVPDENILGEVGKGGNVLMRGLNYERLLLAAGALGLAQAAVNEVEHHISQRKQFGKPVGFNQAIAHKYADCISKINSVREQVYALAKRADQKIPITNSEAASAFLNASVMAKNVTRDCLEMFGGLGLTSDVRMARLVRDSQLYATGGGTEDIRRDIIARDEIEGYDEHVKKDQYLSNEFNDMSLEEIKKIIKAGKEIIQKEASVSDSFELK